MTLSLLIVSGSKVRSLCSIITSWSVFLDFAKAIALGSGLFRFIWNFFDTSKKYVLIIFAMKGMRVSSLYLKKAINTHMRKSGSATTAAVPLGVQLLVRVFRTAKVNHNQIAKIINWTMVILAGPTLTLILSHPHEIFLGINIFMLYRWYQ